MKRISTVFAVLLIISCSPNCPKLNNVPEISKDELPNKLGTSDRKLRESIIGFNNIVIYAHQAERKVLGKIDRKIDINRFMNLIRVLDSDEGHCE